MNFNTSDHVAPAISLPASGAPMGAWADFYRRLDWAIFPCSGKVPLTPNGFKDATTDPAQIAAWWDKWPDANIATAMDAQRYVLDIDPRAGGDSTFHDLGPVTT